MKRSTWLIIGLGLLANAAHAADARVRRRGSGNPNNVSPDGPCWFTGGVGRRAGYYAGGRIQNPGRPSVAAGFERGLPYGLTRQGQLEAQRIGNDRARYYYRYSYRYPWGWSYWIWP